MTITKCGSPLPPYFFLNLYFNLSYLFGEVVLSSLARKTWCALKFPRCKIPTVAMKQSKIHAKISFYGLLPRVLLVTSVLSIHGQSEGGLDSLGAKGDKHQVSPNIINAQSTEEVMRIDQMITKGKMLGSFFEFSQLIQ